MVATEIDLPGTLLASAVSLRKARFVRDCTSYMQSSARPARDIFTQTAQLVASLLVVPFVYCEDAPLAALYLTLEAPNDFAHIQGPLLVRPPTPSPPRSAPCLMPSPLSCKMPWRV
jgi:hypothetical protein